ncbi:MAG TPA: hypothetical protein VGD87_00700, partial [Archangium sp.]
ATGGGIALLGGYFMLMAALTSSFGVMLTANPLFVLAVGSFVIGAPLMVIGIWLLVTRVEQRNLIDAEIGKLRQEMNRRQQPQRTGPWGWRPVEEAPTMATVARF